MLNNIPLELRRLPQWVVSGPDKVPINPRTGRHASPTDPKTRGTFEEARECGYANIGFMLSPNDPFTIIDLDDKPSDPATEAQRERFSKILDSAASYSELSTSGSGVHIIVRGSVPKGCRRDHVEVYSQDRYMICTGNVIRSAPVAERQALLDALFAEMQPDTLPVELEEVDEELNDADLYEMATNAANAAKFMRLWEGDLSDYPSQSEADFALMSMLVHYSPSNEQCRRLFRLSKLGERAKAMQNNKHLDRMLAKLRGKAPPLIDLSKLTTNANRNRPEHQQSPDALGTPDNEETEGEGEPSPEETEETHPSGFADESIQGPDGLVGELAEYLHSTSIRPVREYALASAIALCAGISGRGFNISGTGLNLYLIAVGATGSGKESIPTGIDMMVHAMQNSCLLAQDFVGPGNFGSGQALVRALDKQPCFVSILGEVGLLLQELSNAPLGSPARSMLRMMLDLYTKSGHGKILRPSVYSDSMKNTQMVRAPSVTIMGESTPDNFYDALNSSMILDGMVPRFSVFEYRGPRPVRNRNAGIPPSEDLVNRMSELGNVALGLQQDNTFCPVPISPKAQKLLDAFDLFADDEINKGMGEASRQTWNRAHLKALKLAALVAVGNNPVAPVVGLPEAEWAIKLVRRDITKLLAKFEEGAVGATGDMRLESDIKRAILDWFKMQRKDRLGYKGVTPKMATMEVIPIAYLRRRCRPLKAFQTDRRGASKAMEETLKKLVEAGELGIVPPMQANIELHTNAPVYVRGLNWS